MKRIIIHLCPFSRQGITKASIAPLFRLNKNVVLLAACLCGLFPAEAQPLKTKVIDDGGTGMFKAIAVKEKSMPDFVIYRPKDLLHAHARRGALPVLLFGNGGCADTSIGYERMLTEVASHGYVVVAIGEMQDKRSDRVEGHSESAELTRGLDLLLTLNRTKGSDYYHFIDTARIAAAGHSCGGAQVLFHAGDPRLMTYLILNAGMGDMEMAGADSASLQELHAPVLYIVGGPGDVAYGNAQKDYNRISHVPVCLANHPASGHGGTYNDPYGGDYGRMVTAWLDWQMRGLKENANIFLKGNLKDYPGWEMKAKNFKQRPGQFLSLRMPCSLLNGATERDYSVYLPGSYNNDTLRRYPVLYLMHGGGGSHTDYEKYHRLSQLTDSLIDAGEVKDMIIVCAEGNQGHMMYFNTEPGKAGAPDWQYEDYFFRELIPYIEQTYRVRTDKGGRAIAGFSMGGGAATVYGIHHPEMFSMVYDISGYLRRQSLPFLKGDPSAGWRQQTIADNDPVTAIENASENQIRAWKQVDWKISVGDRDFTLAGNMDLAKAFRMKGIPFSMYVNDGEHNGRWVQPALEDAIRRADRNFESLWIQNGDRHIYGILSKPLYTGEKQPVVIISHGFNGSGDFGRSYFKALNALGYQCYTFDFPCGSVRSRSDNNTMNMSVLDEQCDLEAIVRYFRMQPDVDSDRIVLIGESQGGFVSALTAASIPKEIYKLVLIYPALCIPDNWNERYPDASLIPDTTRMWNVPLGRRYFTEVRDIKVFRTIPKYKGPVLIIQGDADPVVSMEDSKKAVRKYRDASLHVIPGAGHGFKEQERAEAIEQIRVFLTRVSGR